MSEKRLSGAQASLIASMRSGHTLRRYGDNYFLHAARLQGVSHTARALASMGYIQRRVNSVEHIYELTEKGKKA